MSAYEVDESQVREDDRNSHSVELVASVSFDRQKRQFNYDKFDPSKFNAGDSYNHIRETQDKAINAAQARFKAADTMRSNRDENLDLKKGLSLIEEELSETEIPTSAGSLKEVILKRENPSKKYKIEKKLNSVQYIAREKTNDSLF